MEDHILLSMYRDMQEMISADFFMLSDTFYDIHDILEEHFKDGKVIQNLCYSTMTMQ